MGWGSMISAAFEVATDIAKAAAQVATQTAKTAWDYTKQNVSEVYGTASNAVAQVADSASQKANSAQKWIVQKGHEASQISQQTSKAVGEAFDKICDSFTGQTAGAPAKDCPLAAKPGDSLPPPPRGNGICQPPPPCFTKPLTVKCGHGSRAFLLIPPNTPTNNTFDQVIQVIADQDEKDTITIDFAASACARGCGANLPSLKFEDAESKSTLVVAVSGPPSPLLTPPGEVGPSVPFVEFAGHFIRRCDGAGYRSYSGIVQCGEGGKNQSFQVQAYPKREWAGKISASFEIPENKGDSMPNSGLLYSKSKARLKISGELSGSYGVRRISVKPPSLEIGAGKTGAIIGSKQAFSGVKRFLDTVYPAIKLFKDSRYVKIEPIWPNVELGGGMRATEVKGRYNVSWKGDVSLALSPLFGLSGKFDAMQWLIDVACYVYLQPPPFAKFVSDQIKFLRDKAEEGFGDESGGAKVVARIDIEAKGSISGTLKWEFLPDEKDKATGKVSGDLDISVKGEVSGELRAWKVSYQAGASIVGESGVAGKIDSCFRGDEPFWDGYFEFKGLTIKAMAFQSIGGSSVGSGKEGKGDIADRKAAKKKGKSWWNPFEVDTESVRAEDSASWEMEIIKPATWGKEGEDAGGGDAIKAGGGSFGGGGTTGSYTSLAAGL